MNPFTHFLRRRGSDPDFDRFVSYWDRLELLVVQVYRAKTTPEEAAGEYAAVWPWLRVEYGRWQPLLDPYWRQTRAAGETTQTDPFLLLLAIGSPAAIPGDWPAMQHLPAAREAINRYLLAP
jgi:hypothetical protein